MIELSTENFESEVIHSDAPVFVVFTAPWCGHCHSMLRNMEIMSHQLTDVKIASVDIDKEPLLGKKYSVRSVPTSVIFKNGKPCDKATGVLSKPQILYLLGIKPKANTTI